MHIKPLLLFTLISSSLSPAFASILPAQIKTLEQATAKCFDEAQNPDSGNLIRCEVSAVSRVDDTLILVNDKPFPGKGLSPVFSLALQNNKISEAVPDYLDTPVITQARKFEALTTTLDNQYFIASTAFNRVGTAGDKQFDRYNTIVYWPVGKPERAKVASPSVREEVTSSIGLREQISEALGAPFFQIEGMSVAPGNRLLMGIRKQGDNHESARDVFKVLAATFILEGEVLQFTEPFKLIFEFTPNVPGQEFEELGLSSIEFDRYNNDRFYALTSFEDEHTISGYLWSIPLEGLLQGDSASPQLVRAPDGLALRFANKPEGLEVLDHHYLLIVHDDDRVQVESSPEGIASKANEFAYTVVGF